VHDDAVEQGAAVEHVVADLRDRLGDLDDLELGVACEGVLEEMKKEKKKEKKRGGGEVELRERFQDGEKKKRKGKGGLLTLTMDSSLLGPLVVSKTTRAISPQLLKALFPMLVTEAGMVTSVRPSAS